MSKSLISIAVGSVAGIIDVAPMLLMKLNRNACSSAFVHWVITAFLIAHSDSPWLKGLIIAPLTAVPIVIIVVKDDKMSVAPVMTMSVVPGVLTGVTAGKFSG